MTRRTRLPHCGSDAALTDTEVRAGVDDGPLGLPPPAAAAAAPPTPIPNVPERCRSEEEPDRTERAASISDLMGISLLLSLRFESRSISRESADLSPGRDRNPGRDSDPGPDAAARHAGLVSSSVRLLVLC